VLDFKLKRIGVIMEPTVGDPNETEGVLNPAAMRGRMDNSIFSASCGSGQLFSHRNRRVLFDRAGDPINVERMGIALEPEPTTSSHPAAGMRGPPHRLRWSAAALCDDLHGTFAPWPRIAIAISDDLFHWRRKGLAVFHPYKGITLMMWTIRTPACFLL